MLDKIEPPRHKDTKTGRNPSISRACDLLGAELNVWRYRLRALVTWW